MTTLVPEAGAVQLILALEEAGALTPTSLDLTDASLPLDQWLSIGRMFGQINRSVNWWVGDWLNFGEDVYGEDYAQGVDDIQSRYVEAERITGLDHGTLMNISSVCRRVAKSRRRPEVGFWIHAEVAALEPAEQATMLQQAIEGSWNRADLRRAIRGEQTPSGGVVNDPPSSPVQRIESAARAVVKLGKRRSNGDVIVPADAWAQLISALGGD